MSRVTQFGVTIVAFVLSFGTTVWAQESAQEFGSVADAVNDYCGNMGTVKTISPEQIVINGMNWNFESDSETVEETYVIDSGAKVELDGYKVYADIKEDDFIGIECQKKNGKMIVTLIQSEEAINKAFEDAQDEGVDMGLEAAQGIDETNNSAPQASLPAVDQQPATVVVPVVSQPATVVPSPVEVEKAK